MTGVVSANILLFQSLVVVRMPLCRILEEEPMATAAIAPAKGNSRTTAMEIPRSHYSSLHYTVIKETEGHVTENRGVKETETEMWTDRDTT